ncbi:ATP-dependent endonuclease [Rhizobium ruizarguesonis]|nr:ATP-dependent endonuclease [Rhizobium ruizarguesonis]TBD15794.1 ATP-dependent endonuclease [Rhizobium ruizarguesonis]TBD27711.1 ATP-dependent endonuclease [Rhizobium ruizarguesonis]TBE96808.1 ATP-dependent endonuclease [Rhizobium ruizarguesonis]
MQFVDAEVGKADDKWPLKFKINLLKEAHSNAVINILPGITTLVGPNGSGKTRALRAIKSGLQAENLIERYGRKIHFLAAGRSSPLENYRAAIRGPGNIDPGDAAVGHTSHKNQWWEYESITGSFLALDSRADLRLKVEARLQQLFDRSVQLSWSQQGLNLRILPVSGGTSYAANVEASGVLQLVALLAAIHNDEIGCLLIDEPEISLHPQHQAFILDEMVRVAGDPADPAKKLIVIATHSVSMLSLRRSDELPSIAFFNSVSTPPAQVHVGDALLKRKKLGALVARLSTTHRMAMFAERVLLVEGPTDEVIATQLARRLDLHLLARNAQILPVIGKGEFGEAAKLFEMMNKKVAVLADLDALADDNSLVLYFSNRTEAAGVADRLGRSSLADLDSDVRNELGKFITKYQASVDEAARSYADWSSTSDPAVRKRRLTLARLLTDPSTFASNAVADAERLSARFEVLVQGLAEVGCFFLRRGAIENYYQTSGADRTKPDLAAEETVGFDTRESAMLHRTYEDVIRALVYTAPNQRVDDDLLLRPKLGAVLAAAFLGMKRESSDDQLNAIARTTIGSDAEVFRLSNKSTDKGMRIGVDIASPLFKRDAFPFEISCDENSNIVVPNKLPGLK